MLALQILSLKTFMNHLLAGDTFDIFLLEEATIRTANTFTIDGRIHREFYAEEEKSALSDWEFRPWSELKGLCFDLVKGKRTPLYFHFVLHLKPEKALALLEQKNASYLADALKAMVLTLRYDGSKALLTTGISYRSFTMDKDAELLWEQAVTKFLTSKEIPFEQL